MSSSCSEGRRRMTTAGTRGAMMVSAALGLIALSAVGTGSAAGPVGGCGRGSIHDLRSNGVSYAATAVRALKVGRALGNRASTRFESRNANGVATVFGVLAVRVDRSCRATHYKVQLPIRPNGTTGWVRAVDVRVRKVTTRIEIDLSQRRLTLFRDGRIVLLTSAADRRSVDSHADRAVLRQPATPRGQPDRRVRARGRRHFRLFPGAAELAPGRADRDPRHGCPRHDRVRRVTRMPPCSQFRRLAPAAPRGRGDAGRDQGVIRQVRRPVIRVACLMVAEAGQEPSSAQRARR